MKIIRYVGDLAASIFAKDAQNETRAIFGDENQSDDLTANIDNQKFREGWIYVLHAQPCRISTR